LLLLGGGCFSTTTETRTEQSYTVDEDTGEITYIDENGAPAMTDDPTDGNPVPITEGIFDLTSGLTASWAAVDQAAKDEDCDAFRSTFVDTVEITDEDCVRFFELYAVSPPDISFATGSKFYEYTKADGTKVNGAEVYMVNGIKLTTFFQEEDGVWRASTKYWR
ncbi:MAG: hypothetical protein ABH846_00230, partial [Patescibacteria group bacterium]